MIDLQTLLVFVPIALALNLTPGADMLFCLGQGTRAGPRAGLAASFGIAAGSFLHALAGGLGLAAVLAANPLAFDVIRWGGVAYLVWLACQAFTANTGFARSEGRAATGPLQAWREGLLVCLLNPKVAIFMLALVPQFVDPERGSILVQFLIFGTILNIGGTLINAAVGICAGRISGVLAANRHIARCFEVASGLIFVALAARLAFGSR